MTLTRSTEQPSFLARHGQKLVGLLFWLTLIIAYIWYTTTNDLTPLAAVQALIEILQNSPYGPLIYIIVYIVRPLIFFSAALLTLSGGFIFGPLGILYTIIGSNISSTVAYFVGRYFGQGLLDSEEAQGLLQRYTARMRKNSFESVLVMRFIFLPYDLVSYAAGFLKIRYVPFILATILGSIPGTITFVLFGASIEGDFTGGTPSFNPVNLAISAVLFVVSLALSRFFRAKDADKE